MTDPPRLLDGSDQSFGARLLRTAERDKPSSRATRRALGVAAAASAAGLSTASAAAAKGALAKSVIAWMLVGGLGGAVVSVSARRIAEQNVEREAYTLPARATAVVSSTSPRAPAPLKERSALPSPTILPESLALPPIPSPAAEPAPTRLDSKASSSHRAPGAGHAAANRHAVAAPAPQGERETASISGETGMLGHSEKDAAFSDEMRVIDAARQRLSAGDAASTLTLLSRYEASFPVGHFLPEALALRVEALAASGQATHARRAAQRFLAGYPGHPLSARVRAALARLP